MFQQMPMVEIDGMKLVQTRAILNYIATKYDLYGKDMKERAPIDMYSEGVTDLGEMIILLPVNPPDQKDVKMTLIRERTTNRYLPAFEKHGTSGPECCGRGFSLTRLSPLQRGVQSTVTTSL
ncbi:glutathione S-transferase A2-like [Megaptera novaeangliae]